MLSHGACGPASGTRGGREPSRGAVSERAGATYSMAGLGGQPAAGPKTDMMLLNELSQRLGEVIIKPDPKQVSRVPPFEFEAELMLDKRFATGRGSSKKLAQQAAAKRLLAQFPPDLLLAQFPRPTPGVEATAHGSVDEIDSAERERRPSASNAEFELHRDARRESELHAKFTSLPPAPLFLDLEFGYERAGPLLALVQLAGRGGPAHLLDTVAEPRLAELLTRMLPHDATERVVLHGGGQDQLVLASHGVLFRELRVFDTQVAHEILTGKKERSLHDTVEHWLGSDHGLVPNKDSDDMRRFMKNNQWLLAPRPLPPFALQYAAKDVLCLEPTYNAMLKKLDSAQLALALRLSVDKDELERWRKTQAEEKWRASKAAPAAAADHAHPL